MTDVRADDLDEGERLPWLEAVEEDEARDTPSAIKLIVAVLIGLAAIGGIVGGIFWLGNREASPNRPPELIKAPEGDYKTKPPAPGGMQVEGEGDSSYAASAGAEPKGNIDVNAMPEAPVTKAEKPAPPPPVAKTAEPAAPKAKPAAPAPAPVVAAGPTIQLGAFSSNAVAEGAWKTMSGRFKYLAPLSHHVVSVQIAGKTFYRLRASGADAKGICSRLRVAGENCVPVD
jgi:hypothetical protein